MGRISEVTDSVLDEVIEYLKNTNIAGEFDCAIENYHEVFKKHNVDTFCDYIADIDSHTPVGSMQRVVDGANIKTDVDSFIHDYYEEVIKCVCNVIESFKSADGEEKYVFVFEYGRDWMIVCYENGVNTKYFNSAEDSWDNSIDYVDVFLKNGGNKYYYKLPDYDYVEDIDIFDLENEPIEELGAYLKRS